MARRILLLSTAVAVVVLLPWTVHLADTLPDRYATGQWRVAWVGFDAALACCFAAAVWLGLRRRRAAVPLLAATAALLVCDAWFDVSLDWGSPDRSTSMVMAGLVELPFAGLLLIRARLITGGMRSTQLTMRHLQVRADPGYRRMLSTLDELAPATSGRVARALGTDHAIVERQLGDLGRLGLAQRRRDGTWRLPPHQDLRLPALDVVRAADRPQLMRHLDAKFRAEVDLLTWAAQHHAEFGAWGRSERAVTHLTEAELVRLNTEYRELITRYFLLRSGPTPATREVAVRFYVFPVPPAGPQAESVRRSQTRATYSRWASC